MALFRFIFAFFFTFFSIKGYANPLFYIGKPVYIAYMGERPVGQELSLSTFHHGMLESVLASKDAANKALFHSYGRSFNGFAARLSEEEDQILSEMDGVAAVFPETMVQLQTTRSWNFMGFPQSQSNHDPEKCESDVIIGMVDTGIWPESKSFSDEGFAPPPQRFKGICQPMDNFTCTNKIIGARYYNAYQWYEPQDYKSAKDSFGHGTHTTSVAAGRIVENASYYGLAQGTARGGAPGARIAVYKVCWSWSWMFGCPTNGVDIISISISNAFPTERCGCHRIISCHEEGNFDLDLRGKCFAFSTFVSSVAPWSLSVAASTIDRRFATQVVLGNGLVFISKAKETTNACSFPFPIKRFPIRILDVHKDEKLYILDTDALAFLCEEISLAINFVDPNLIHTLDANKVQGKIVLCDMVLDTAAVFTAGGVGTITLFPQLHNPTATILYSDTWTDAAAPVVTSFSLRGPNAISLDILKPDIAAPGNDILGAWAPPVPPSVYHEDDRPVDYNFESGTSIACPHATDAAAYVKSFHPTWSGSAIKSALMTTASRMDPKRNEDAEFGYGAGHIDPVREKDPGLVYDADEQDYIDFLCNQGYNSTLIRLISRENTKTCTNNGQGSVRDLNYPSMALSLEDGNLINGSFTRTVTNPSTLSFTEVGEKKSFVVKVKEGVISQHPIISSSISWRDREGLYEVRSPLIIFNSIPFLKTNPFSGLKSKDTIKKKTTFGQAGGKHRFTTPLGFYPLHRLWRL
ncbi:hypothetical protein AMTRI_Chr11g93830 [Amborella trichopoda]